jgi:O-antigen ligase
MTSQVPMGHRTAILVSASPAGVAAALDRLAYGMLCAFVFAVPWEEAVPMLGGFVIGRWLGLAAFAIVLLRLAATRLGRPLAAPHYGMLALVGWAALSVLWTVDLDITLVRIGTYLQLLTAVWLIWELALTQKRVVGLLQAYVLGAGVSSLWVIANFIAGRTAAQLAASMGRNVWETSRYSISGFNENDLGLMLALSIPMTFYLLTSLRASLRSALYWLQLAACVTAILLTGSRGALLAATVALAMFPLTMSRMPHWPRRRRLTALALCLAVVAGGAYLAPESSWRRLSEIGTEMTQGTMTHRTVIWAAGMEAFREHAFLGVGAGAYAPAVVKTLDIPYVAHNTFLSVLVELGVVGALLGAALLAGLFDCARRMARLERRLWTVLLLTWVVGVSALTWEYRKPTWLLFGLLAAHVWARRGERLYVISRGGQRPIEAAREGA